MNKTISFLGAGNMALGIIRGMIADRVCDTQNIHIYDIRADRMTELCDTYGVTPCPDAETAIKKADILVIAVRPQDTAPVFAQIREQGRPDQLILSVCAGITLETLARAIGADRRIARVMPNTLIEARLGYSALCTGPLVTDGDRRALERIFDSIGQTMHLDERLFDAFTAFSCTGPEYLLYYLTALMDAGVQSGFSREDARRITLANCAGIAKMLELTGLHPYVLSDMMSSPAGCGIEGLSVLYESGMHGVLMQSVRAALRRTEEMGRA